MPSIIIDPSLPSKPSSIGCNSNYLCSSPQVKVKNQVFVANCGNEFSVSSQLNADSGSTGTYIAIRDTNNLTEVQPCTPNSRIGVMVANGQTIFSKHTVC